MSLPAVQGHADILASLADAVAARRIPNSLLIHGDPGVGKQRVALWIGQLLLCEKPSTHGPCDACHSCRLAVRLEHPDLHWFFPLPRPKGSADRMGEALEEARFAEIAARRSDPLRATVPDGMAGIYLAHVHVLVRSAGRRPAMGHRKVFVVGDCEALVPQEASPEAANAMLKLLEEPPSDTTVILTASDPDVLLPTIRSRLLPIRLRSLPQDTVHTFLREHAGAGNDDARRAARLADGSIGRALGYLTRNGEDGPLEEIRQSARGMLAAALDPSAAPRMAAALAESPAGARGAFSDTLAVLTLWLRDLAAAGTGAGDVVMNSDSVEWLVQMASRHPAAVAGVPAALREVEATVQLTQLNINPQLALAGLLRAIHSHLSPAPSRH
jgi:DNA polymerase III subunit delta'